jgi:hypothetical protein
LPAGVALLVVSGCGGSPRKAVVQAAERTLATPGYKVSSTSTVRLSPADGRPLVVTGRGFVDNRNQRTRIEITGALAGDEIVDNARATVVYLRVPTLSAKKPWLRFEVSPQLWRSHFNHGAVTLAQGNPAQYVRALGGLAGKVRKLGSGLYTATIPVAGRARLVAVAVAGGYLRQLRFSYSVAVPGWKSELVYHTTISYGGFGPQPPIALPAPSQVATIGADGKVEQ